MKRIAPFILATVVYSLTPTARSEPEADTIRVVLTGDSTMQTYLNPPKDKPDLTGWGQVFGECFSNEVEIINLGKSGRSSKSFRSEGLWDAALRTKAHFVFIQFGHNDQPGRPMSSDPKTEFPDNLRRFVREARQAGIRPVLLTPVARRTFAGGKAVSILGPYVDAIKLVGKETATPVIDLHASSLALYDKLGDAGSADFGPSKTDRSHFSRKGAREIARLVAEELPAAVPELGAKLKAR